MVASTQARQAALMLAQRSLILQQMWSRADIYDIIITPGAGAAEEHARVRARARARARGPRVA